METENFITDAFSSLKDKISSLASGKSSEQTESKEKATEQAQKKKLPDSPLLAPIDHVIPKALDEAITNKAFELQPLIEK